MARPTTITGAVPTLWRILRFFAPWLRRERRRISLALGALFTAVLIGLAEPWPLKFVLDRVIPTDRPPGMNSLPWIDALEPATLLVLAAVAVVAIGAARAYFDYHQQVALARVGNRVLRQVRNHVFLHVQELSLAFHHRSRSGDLILRVTRDVSLLRDVTSTAVFPLVANAMILAGMVGIMLFLQWKLALLAISTLPFFWLSAVRHGRGIHRAARKQRKREGAMASTAAESITAIRDVQALSLGSAFADGFATLNAQSQEQELKGAKLTARLVRTTDLLLAASSALVLGYGANLVLRGALTPGDLLVFLSYLKRAFHPVKDFAKHTGRLAKAAAAGERVMALLDETPEVRDRPDAVAAPRLAGAIRFEQVGFDYGTGHLVLQDVDLSIEPGEFIAITGPSGSGKSTLAGLVLRLFDPTCGTVWIDGRDVREYRVASLRSQVSVVLQDSFLFASSVADNVACGDSDAAPTAIEAACRLARAHEFITAMPDGYATIVGERGQTLSRGERQRIALARAALRRAPILILDEPTTGLDEQSEREVGAALRELARGATTLLITHDLALVERADRIVYVEGGRIAECGTPGELLRGSGRFARMRSMQAGGGSDLGH